MMYTIGCYAWGYGTICFWIWTKRFCVL